MFEAIVGALVITQGFGKLPRGTKGPGNVYHA